VTARSPSPDRFAAFLLLFAVVGVAIPSHAQSLQLFGYAGLLGEWEMTATVTANASRPAQEFSGPLTMTHVGLCTQDGPEQKVGEMTVRISAPSRLNATLLIGGVECSYSATLSDFYSGAMTCPDRETVPLKMWVKK
jgi:hypothetical protein